MGPRSVFFTFLLGGIPIVVATLSVLIALVLRADGSVVALSFPLTSIGVAFLVSANLPLLRTQRLASLGPTRLSRLGQAVYWCGYIVIGFGALFLLEALVPG